MAYGDDKNKFSKREEKQLRKTSKCKGAECAPSKRIRVKGEDPFKKPEDIKGEPVRREKPKVRYERYYQKGFNVTPPPKDPEEKIVHTEEKYALFEKNKGAATEKDIKDVEKMNINRKVETKTVAAEKEKKPQYTEGQKGGFKTGTQEFLEKKSEKKETVPFLKETEGFIKTSKKEPEYKFRSTREDEKQRLVGKFEKSGKGTITITDKEKRGEAYRELSKNRKKAARVKSSPEKLEKYYKRRGAVEKLSV